MNGLFQFSHPQWRHDWVCALAALFAFAFIESAFANSPAGSVQRPKLAQPFFGIADEEICEDTKNSWPKSPGQQFAQLRELTVRATRNDANPVPPRPVARPTNETLGNCYDDFKNNRRLPGGVSKRDFVGKTIREDIEAKFKRGDFPKMRKDGRDSVKDWLAVDIIARALIAEVGSQHCTHAERLAVTRILLNRIDFAEKHAVNTEVKDHKGNLAWTRFVPVVVPHPSTEAYFNEPNLVHPAIYTIQMDQQFSFWNPGDAAWAKFACPTGKHSVPHSTESEIWKKSVQAAELMVFQPDLVKQSTPEITELFYTSGEKTYKRYSAARREDKDGKMVRSWTHKTGKNVEFTDPTTGRMSKIPINQPKSAKEPWSGTCMNLWDDSFLQRQIGGGDRLPSRVPSSR